MAIEMVIILLVEQQPLVGGQVSTLLPFRTGSWSVHEFPFDLHMEGDSTVPSDLLNMPSYSLGAAA